MDVYLILPPKDTIHAILPQRRRALLREAAEKLSMPLLTGSSQEDQDILRWYPVDLAVLPGICLVEPVASVVAINVQWL